MIGVKKPWWTLQPTDDLDRFAAGVLHVLVPVPLHCDVVRWKRRDGNEERRDAMLLTTAEIWQDEVAERYRRGHPSSDHSRLLEYMTGRDYWEFQVAFGWIGSVHDATQRLLDLYIARGRIDNASFYEAFPEFRLWPVTADGMLIRVDLPGPVRWGSG